MHEEVIEMYNRGELAPELFYTHTMDFADFEKGFPMLAAKKAGKIVFVM